jgi:hypothetical protein
LGKSDQVFPMKSTPKTQPDLQKYHSFSAFSESKTWSFFPN